MSVCTVKVTVQGETGNYRIHLRYPEEGGNSVRIDSQVLMVYGSLNDELAKWHYFPVVNLVKYSTEVAA